MMEYLKGLILILIIAEIFLSGFLVSTEFTGKDFCLTGESCKIVRNSSYSELFGIKLSFFGFFSFVALLIIYLLAYNKKINYLFFLSCTIIGAFFALYFLYLQIFVIKALCSNCLAVDSTAVIIAFLSVLNLSKD